MARREILTEVQLRELWEEADNKGGHAGGLAQGQIAEKLDQGFRPPIFKTAATSRRFRNPSDYSHTMRRR